MTWKWHINVTTDCFNIFMYAKTVHLHGTWCKLHMNVFMMADCNACWVNSHEPLKSQKRKHGNLKKSWLCEHCCLCNTYHSTNEQELWGKWCFIKHLCCDLLLKLKFWLAFNVTLAQFIQHWSNRGKITASGLVTDKL